MHNNGLDDIDNRILDLLRENARMSFSEIGNKVGMSRVAIKTRIKAMEESGVIQGYRALIDPSQEAEAIPFFLDMETAPEWYNDVLEELAMNKLIRQVYSVTGECRIHAVGSAPNRKELNRYANSLYANTRGIRKLWCSTILATIKDTDGGVDYVRHQEHEHLESRGTDHPEDGRV